MKLTSEILISLGFEEEEDGYFSLPKNRDINLTRGRTGNGYFYLDRGEPDYEEPGTYVKTLADLFAQYKNSGCIAGRREVQFKIKEALSP